MKFLISMLSAISFSFHVNAVTREAPNPITTTSVTPSPTPSGTPVSLYEASLDAANSSSNSTGTVLATAATAGGIAAAVCGHMNPTCAAWALTAATFGGAIANSFTGAHNQSQDALNGVSTDHPTTTPPPDNTTTTTNTNTPNTYVQRYNNSIEQLRRQGVLVDPNKGTVTMPDGKTYSTSALNSPAAMQAAGLNPADLGKIQNQLKDKVEKELAAHKAADGSSDGVNGNFGGSHAATAAGSGLDLPTVPRVRADASDREPASIQGLSVNYDGSPIGVSQSDLFQAIHNRVKAVDNREGFLTSP